MANTPKTRKAKGRNFQNWVVKSILDSNPQLTDRDVRGAVMGEKGVDVKLSEEGLRVFPYSVECKAVESINVWECWKQAQANKEKNTQPILFIKRNHTDPIVVVDASYFIELVSKLNV